MVGIDERLHKGFATAFEFGSLPPGVLEAMDRRFRAVIDRRTDCRRTFDFGRFRVFCNLSSALMLKHTPRRQYLEVFAATNVDGIVNEKERTMLNLQAKAFGIDDRRQRYLEAFSSEEQA